MKIGILGMGGIGSFIGAKLTKSYENNKEVEIVFICRNKTKDAISKNGLSLITDNATITSKPHLVSDNPLKIGLLDILIVATKSFSLENAIKIYKSCLKKDTVIIPMQNGVDAKNVIFKNSNHNNSNILEGCIYVASNIEKPGVVKHMGGPGKIFFGNNNDLDFKWVENILIDGGLDVVYTKSIKEIVWKKYLFVSPLATITSAYNITFGQLLEEPKYMTILESMMKEVQILASKLEIIISEDDIKNALSMLSNFPYQSKSSLQLDIDHQNTNTEKDILVDYVITNADKFGFNATNYKEMETKIATRINSYS